MTHGYEQVDPVGAKGLSRRTGVKGAAWTAPVVAVAVAAPMAAASGEPSGEQCVFDGGAWRVPEGSVLYHNGEKGYAAGTQADGTAATGQAWPVYTTGYTPKLTWQQFEDAGYSVDKNRIVISEYYGGNMPWYGSASLDAQPGFLSMDDRDNTDGVDQGDVSFTVTYTASASKGTPLALAFPVAWGSVANGLQGVAIAVSGPGLSYTNSISVGDKAISKAGALAGYTHKTSQGLEEVALEVTPNADGPIVIEYTFTLPYVHGGNRQNADIWVGQPQVTNCLVS